MPGRDAVAERRVFKVLLTAAQAYPELEKMFLESQSEIDMCFRVFDPWTRLRSDRARDVGDTWIDLIADTLARGVKISLAISDFDPVVRPDYHRATWASIRAVIAAGEISGRPELLHVRPSMHPSRIGILPRLLFWPRTYGELCKTVDRINACDPPAAERFLAEVPALHSAIRRVARRLAARVWPPSALIPVSTHQKLAVFDRSLLYIGGLDLDERRYDTPQHERAADRTWHDVQLVLSGPEVADALTHLDSFEAVTHGQREAPQMTGLLRTISRRRRFQIVNLSPVPCVTELADVHAECVASAVKLIYLETQFFRDRTLARQLARAAQIRPDLKLILILPAAPEDVAFDDATSGDARYGEYLQAKCVDIVRKAFGTRVFIGSPARQCTSNRDDRGQIYGAPLIYLHAKVSVFDDRSAIVSSANLNGRSMNWDTEAGVRLARRAEVETVRRTCFSHWLGADADPGFFDLDTALEAWQARARANARARPEARQGFILPYSSAPARRFGRSIPGIPEEMV